MSNARIASVVTWVQAAGFTFAGFLVESFGPKGTYAICGVASLLATPLLAPMFRALRSEGEVEKRQGSQ